VVQSLVKVISLGFVLSPVSVFREILVCSTKRSCRGWFFAPAWIMATGFLILRKAS
jgi:hypothetical protein